MDPPELNLLDRLDLLRGTCGCNGGLPLPTPTAQTPWRDRRTPRHPGRRLRGALAEIAAEEEVALIKCEDNMGDGMFRRLLEPYVTRRRPCAVDGYKVHGQKELRILGSLEPALAQHRVVMDATCAQNDLALPDNVRRGLYQLTHITSARGSLKHDDRVEVLAAAVGHFTELMNADANKAEQAWQRKQDEAWEREFFKGTIVGHNHLSGPNRASGRAVGRVAGRKLSKKVSW